MVCGTPGHTAQQEQRVDAIPAVSITRGLVLMTLRTPPMPQEAPAARALLVQQSPTKAAMQVGRLAGVEGFRHCRHRHRAQAHKL